MKFHIVASGSFTPRQPFDFAKSLAFAGRFPMMAGEQKIFGETMCKGAWLDGVPVICSLRAHESELRYTLFAERPLSSARIDRAEVLFGRFLSLDDDLEPFYAIARNDVRFATLVDAGYGFHQVRFFTPIEIAIWAILGQRSPLARSRATKRALTERFGTVLRFEGADYPIFPELSVLARASDREMAGIVNDDRKARYICATIAAFAEIDEAFLYDAPLGEVRTFLRNIPGIGAWSENFIALRGLGRMEWCDPNDALIAATSACYAEPATYEAVAARAACYGVYQGHWAFYLRAVPALAAKRERYQPMATSAY